MDNIVDFPNSNSQDNQDEQEHKCDSCASIAIHELAHKFEYISDEEVIETYIDRIFGALEEENIDGAIDAMVDLYYQGKKNGQVEMLKDEIHEKSGLMAMMCNEIDGEEQ